MTTTTTKLSGDFSPVDEAARVLEDFRWSWQREVLRRAPGEKVARHLDGVLNVLIERGWTQDEFWSEAGAVCLVRALSVAADLGYGDSADVQSDEEYRSATYYVANRYLDLMVQARTGRPGAALSARCWNWWPTPPRSPAATPDRLPREAPEPHGCRGFVASGVVFPGESWFN